MTPLVSPGALAARLAALPVRVEAVNVEVRAVVLPDYPGEPRPSGVVTLSGAGHDGRGENVAFTAAEQQAFVGVVTRWFDAQIPDREQDVGSARERLVGSPYEGAALEAALVDLALRQAGLRLSDVTGVTEAKLRYVVSLSARTDPVAAIARHRDRGYTGGFKVDVEPSWSRDVWRALGEDEGVVILDFKRRGDASLAAIVQETTSHALLEDPPPGFDGASALAERISRDAELNDAVAVANAVRRGESVNLKAPRMGGPLEVLRALDCVGQRRTPSIAYLGGMFEIDVGRSQARQLAALYCKDAPNDLAPNVSASERTVSSPPVSVRFDGPGFG